MNLVFHFISFVTISFMATVAIAESHTIEMSSMGDTELSEEDRKIQSQELEVILKLLDQPPHLRNEVINQFIRSGKLLIQDQSVNWQGVQVLYRTITDFHRFRITRDRLSVQTSTKRALSSFISNKKVVLSDAQAMLTFSRALKISGSSEVQPFLSLDFFKLPGVMDAVVANLKISASTSEWGIRPENEDSIALSYLRRGDAKSWTIDKATAFNVLQTFRAQAQWAQDKDLRKIFFLVEKWNPHFQVMDRSQYAGISPQGLISAEYLSRRILANN